MKPVEILDTTQFQITLKRLCHQLIENHNLFENTVLIGLQPRGIFLADRLKQELSNIDSKLSNVPCGYLDITFFRDDFRRREQLISGNTTKIDFLIENKKVVLVDDVLYTGRTIRAGLDAMLAYGRPKQVELLTLIDRRFSRQLPIKPDYVGKVVDAIATERVSVEWKEQDGADSVKLFRPLKDHE
ncbi:MAG: pyrimidine operon attenuation protein/uracil phosphoribosyltransferase [Flavobacteriales bacterium]|jgi:pyrimidine operon attenuation protein/uracil phosphoribosyltransferase